MVFVCRAGMEVLKSGGGIVQIFLSSLYKPVKDGVFMEILGQISLLGRGVAAGLQLDSPKLLFNPYKFMGLLIWVYLCIYFVHRVEHSRLVGDKYKTWAKVSALVAGPVLLLVLFIIDLAKRYSESGRSKLDFLKREVAEALEMLKVKRFVGSRGRTSIVLFDWAGKNLTELYRKDRQTRETLSVTESIISDAVNQSASDILIDPKEDFTYTVRLRVDGVLRTVQQLDESTANAVVSSIKAVSGMDIAERRRPQDGGFTAELSERTVSFRVASAGVINGEKLAVRILGQGVSTLKLSSIGLSNRQRMILENAIKKPSGMLLLCGPTGSGKTTTLYALLNRIDFFTHNVVTVEDPIESTLPNISQIEVNPKADITFGKALRSILRQDPDVICVGEIRDEETAEIAMRASQTGHLVLATIHSGSNISALVRLLDLGITPLLLTSSLNVIVSQRLVRLLCKDCKSQAELSSEQTAHYQRFGIDPNKICRANGCENCYGTGYKGRIGVFDVLVVDDALKQKIINNELSGSDLKQYRDKRRMTNLREEGMRKVYMGLTTVEEVERITADIDK